MSLLGSCAPRRKPNRKDPPRRRENDPVLPCCCGPAINAQPVNSSLVGILVFACVFGAALLAMRLRAALPEHHLSGDTKDTVKLTMGLVATMSALVLGLLVASAKGSYDTQRSAVIQMAGQGSFLDRVLAHCGPEAAEARATLRQAHGRSGGPDLARKPPPGRAVGPEPRPLRGDSRLHPEAGAADRCPARVQKAQALAIAWDLGQMRWLLFEQAGNSISTPLVIIVVCWLAILFFSFGLFGPSNSTAVAALLVAALSVSAAIFLILELDRPFGGLIRISSQPVLNALSQLGH